MPAKFAIQFKRSIKYIPKINLLLNPYCTIVLIELNLSFIYKYVPPYK